MPLPASLHHEPLSRVCVHSICCHMHWEGVIVTFDPEVIKHTTVIEHGLLSFRHLSEAFLTVLPRDIELCDAEWDAIENAIRTVQDAVHAKVGRLLEALDALRGEWTEHQWEGVVLGLLMAHRLDLLSTHPSVENAWVRMQAQQLLRQPPPDPRTEYGGS
jgi:hypothetical protein